MILLYGKKNRIVITALVLVIAVIISAVVSFSVDTELDYVKSQVELLYDELLEQDDRFINSETYLVTDSYISRIRPNTSVEEFTNTLNRKDFTLLEGGKEVSTGIVKTGMELVRGDERYTLVVAGDLNKDGLMNYVDTSMMINNTKKLTDDQLIRLANDFNEDSKYDKTDVLNSVDYILDDKLELKEVPNVNTSVIEFISGDLGDNDWYKGDIKLKLTATEDTEIGYKIIGSVDEIGVVDDGYEITLSGYGAYKVIAWHIGKEGNRSDTTSLVYKIDDREIIPTITYSSTTPGSERVIAAISFNKENVFITNNNGRYTHTFYGNGEFDFEFKDLTGRVGTKEVEVGWINDSVGDDGQWRYSVLNDEEIYLREYLDEEGKNKLLGRSDSSTLVDFEIPSEYEGYTVVGIGNNIDGHDIFGNESQKIYEIMSENGGVYNIMSQLVIPEGVREIGPYSFLYSIYAKDLIIPDSVTKIGDCAFLLNAIFDGGLILSENLKEVGISAFSGFGGLWDYNFETLEKFQDISGEYFGYYGASGDVILPDSLETIGDYSFNAMVVDGSFVLGEGLKNISYGALSDCIFSGRLVISDSIETIKESMFSYSRYVDGVKFGKLVKYIEKDAFYRSSFEEDLIIPSSVETIGERAFSGVEGVQNIVLNNGLKKIGAYAFAYSLFGGDLIIPDSVTSIGEYAFSDVQFTGDLAIGDKITNLNILKKADLNLTTFTGDLVLGNGITTIPDRAFYSTSFTGDLKMGLYVEYVGEDAFAYTPFTGELELSSSIEVIGDRAFLQNKFRGDLILPNRLYSIGLDSFSGNLFDGDLIVETYLTSVYDLNNANINIFGFNGDLAIGGLITSIPDNYFSGANFKGTLSLGLGIETIGNQAFYNNSFTGDLDIPDSVTRIGGGAFSDSGFNGKLILGNGLTSIEEYTFYLNDFTGDLTIPESIKKIYSNAFASNPNLKGTVDVSDISYVDETAFDGTQVTVINYNN